MSKTFSNDYKKPDSELFKTRFPVFTPVNDQLIELVIDEMVDHVGGLKAKQRWRDEDYQPAILYLTAHALTLENEPDRSIAIETAKTGQAPETGGANIGSVQKVKVGDVETWFNSSAGSRAGVSGNSLDGMNEDRFNFSLTHYGRMFIRLRQKNFGGPRVFCP